MKRFFRPYLLIVIPLFLSSCMKVADSRILLKGDWQFQVDPDDKGITERWFEKKLPDNVVLPGSMKENGKGEIPTLKTDWTGSIYDSSFYFNPRLEKYRQPGNIKFPFWLTPNRYYKGAAWYRKEVSIPESWNNRRLVLHLERPHWQTSVWFDDQFIGSQNSLSTAHEFDVTALASSGKHVITVRIDNRLDQINVGPDSHSVTDHTQGNWNGMVGQLYLQAGSLVYIDDIQLYPDIHKKTVKAVVILHNQSQKQVEGSLLLNVSLLNEKNGTTLKPLQTKFNLSEREQVLELEYPMGKNVQLWDEFQPNLYELTAELKTANGESDARKVAFGMRDFTVKDGHFEINGRPVFLRGTVECNTFPLTGYPPTDIASWERIFKICKESGLNHLRFHSHCPPEAAFIAADKLGFYLQPEAASWPNHSSSLGDGRPVDQYILDETARIIKTYGNHPSFVMWAYGNEPRGNYVPFLDKSLREWKAKDKRRVYTGASIGMSWSIIPESEYLVRSGPRGLPFKEQPNSTFNYSEKIADEPRPYVTHEMGQWCVFPNFNEIPKYTGVYKAKNFELFQEDLADHHMADQASDFLMASGKLQGLCYKAEIEATLRTVGLDGFQLLGLNDFPGQGTALIGMLDVFWDEKGYMTLKEISQFCNQTVPLAELDKFVFSNNEPFKAQLRVAHFGAAPLVDVVPECLIFNEQGDTLAREVLPPLTIPIGNQLSLGEINYDLSHIQKASKCKLEVHVAQFKNSWEFWVFPDQLPEIKKDGIFYSSQLDEKTINVLKQGGKVFLNVAGRVENGKDIQAYFTPAFWNTSWFKMRPPHTLGILVQNNHPLFADFPTEFHSNYQWWEILNGQQIMNVDSFPNNFKLLVQPIDTWFLNRRLAQLFEARIGKGRLIVSSLNLSDDDRAGFASRQLLYSINKYMNSDKFNPENELELTVIKELFEKKDRKQVHLYTRSGPDELKPDKKK